MANKKLRITIINNDSNSSYDVLGTYNNNIYEYREPDTDTKVLFDAKKLTLSRSNEEIDMTYDFNNGIGNIFIKELNKELEITIKVLEKEIKEEKISLKYLIEEDIFNYKIEVR